MLAQESVKELIFEISEDFKGDFEKQKFILSFDEYLELLFLHPRRLTRNAAEYFKDMIDFYGITESQDSYGVTSRRFGVFQRNVNERRLRIYGQDPAHEAIYSVLDQFVRQGRVDKLILMHGPNGSSKSSTAEAFGAALEEYSQLEEGIVYRFNWIFPTDKVGFEGLADTRDSKQIGFTAMDETPWKERSFAHLSDDEILCKIQSEVKENPIFLLPEENRIALYRRAIKAAEGRELREDEIPRHLREGGLGAKSKRIFDALLVAYKGDMRKVLQHVQVERFFYSRRYRTGIARVEPQMHVDAQDRQLTLERSLQNLPPVLQNIRLFEPSGELVDANRGFIDFSDLLKRPVEAFKYLLSTIETMRLNLASGVVDLDLIMMGSTNEKYLDAFKASPDWPSFKGRFELVRVPYLLSAKLEAQIYAEDFAVLGRVKPVGPHVQDIMAKWAVLTRLLPPEPSAFPDNLRPLVARLSPFDKLALYDGEPLSEAFTEREVAELRKILPDVRKQAQGSPVYEGRFGASPREVRMMLYFAAQNAQRDSLSALSLFDEIEELTRDRTVYEYLQIERQGFYHDYGAFLEYLKKFYAKQFHREFLQAMNLFDENQYIRAVEKYLRHAVAFVKNEKVLNEITRDFEAPDAGMMDEIEDLMGMSGDKREVRERAVAKIASWRVDNPDMEIAVGEVFQPEIKVISRNIYQKKLEYIQRVRLGMITWGSDDYAKLPAGVHQACEETFENLLTRFGYTRQTSWESLVFLRKTHADSAP